MASYNLLYLFFGWGETTFLDIVAIGGPVVPVPLHR